ncbi:MAG TPA: hypothetical protein PKW80_07850 [Bacteroidales bacterium]|nr:hypothetical protein [Bacteroidales bacterium]
MKSVLLPVLLAIVFNSCNKYEDGPAVSLRSAEKRLTGKWEVTDILFDEKNISTGFFSSHLELYPFSIYSDWGGDYFISISHTDGNLIANSDLILNEKKDKITFAMLPLAPYESISTDIFCTVPVLSKSTEWKILRLKNDELWISTDFSAGNYELHFKLLADYTDY